MAKNEDALRKEAQKQMAKGQYGAALQAYQELLKLRPEDSRLWVSVGDICIKLGQTAQAVKIYEKAAQQYSVNWELMQAINLYNTILKLDPKHPKAAKQITQLQSRLEIQRAAKRNADTVHRWHAEQVHGDAMSVGKDDPSNITTDRFGGGGDNWISQYTDDAPARENMSDWLERGSAVAHDPQAISLASELTQTIEAQDPAAGGRQAKLKQWLERMAQWPALQGVPASTLQAVVGHLDLHELDAGATVLAPGDFGDSIYFVADGAVMLTRRASGGKAAEVGVADAGEFIGEDSFLGGKGRALGAVTSGPTTLIEVTRAGLELLARKHAPLAEALETTYRRRLIAALLAVNPVFQALPEDQARALLKHCEPTTLDPDVVVLEHGAPNGDLYFLVSGTVMAGGSSLVLQDGELFGELSALTGKPVEATYKTASKTRLLKLPAAILERLLKQAPEVLAAIKPIGAKHRKALEA